MKVMPIVFRQFDSLGKPVHKNNDAQKDNELLTKFCETFELPNEKCNYSKYDELKAQKILSDKDNSLASVLDFLKKTDDEKEVTAGLLLVNRFLDNGKQNKDLIYPVVSRFDYNKSPNVQTMLAGVYRKILVPDAFGPLMSMFIKNVENKVTKPFDPNTEVGGALYEYFKAANVDKDLSNAVFSYLNGVGAKNSYEKVNKS